MSVATSGGAVAAAATVISSSAARREKFEKCKLVMDTYDHKVATVQQMQEYADCVGLVHPKELDGGTIILLKIIFVIAIIGGIVSSIKWWDDFDDKDVLFIAGVFILSFCMTAVSCLALIAIGYGFYWVFT
jgi:hypothetical protein